MNAKCGWCGGQADATARTYVGDLGSFTQTHLCDTCTDEFERHAAHALRILTGNEVSIKHSFDRDEDAMIATLDAAGEPGWRVVIERPMASQMIATL